MRLRFPVARVAPVAIFLGVTLVAMPAAVAKKKKAAPSSDLAPEATPQKTPVEIEPEYGPSPPPPPVAPVEVVQKPAFTFTRGKVLVGAKVGGAFAEPFGLGASFVVGVEVGWLLPKLPAVGEGFALAIDALYTQPGASGNQTDPRFGVNGGNYQWSVTQRELSLGLTVLYRAPFVMGGRLVPYLGVGPRLFLLQSATSGEAGSGNAIATYHEQSAHIGVGAPLGADYAVGPGRVFLEAMFLYAPFNHNVTGDGSAGAITIQAGYRLLL